MSVLPTPRARVLFFILFIGASVRLYRIDQPFVDFHGWRESSTAMMAENIYRGGSVFYPEVNWDGPGPSYNGREFQLVTFIAATLYRFTGQVDWIGRLVSVVFSVWGIFALYKLISLVWDERRALAGAAVMAILPGSLFVGREFLPDPAMVALITTGCWLAIAFLRFGRPRDLFLASLTIALGVLTKLTGLCVLIALGYVVWRSDAPHVSRRGLLFSGLLVLIPVALYYAWAWNLARTHPPYHFAGSQGFIWSGSLAAWWAEGHVAIGLWRELNNIWTSLGLAFVLLGLALRQSASSFVPRFFHWWLLISGGLYFAIGASHLVWQPYNLHLFDPPAAALAGHALIAIADAARRFVGASISTMLPAALALAIGLSGVPYLQTVYGSDSSDGHHMGLALRELMVPDDLVVTIPEYAGDPVALYYARRHGWVFPPASVWSTIPENWDEAILLPESVRWLETLKGQGARWLAIVTPQRDRIWKANPALAEYVAQHFEIRKEAPGYVILRIRSNFP